MRALGPIVAGVSIAVILALVGSSFAKLGQLTRIPGPLPPAGGRVPGPAGLRKIRRIEPPTPRIPAGWRGVKAADYTPRVQAAALEILAKLGDEPPGTWLPFQIEGVNYAAHIERHEDRLTGEVFPGMTVYIEDAHGLGVVPLQPVGRPASSS